MTPIPVLIVTGPVGIGKTTVAEAISSLLGARAVPHGWLDVDALSTCYPSPPDDPFNTRMAVRNVGSVWANFRAAGAERLVLAYVIENDAALDLFRAVIPDAAIVVVRLTASPRTNAARLRRRDTGELLAWGLKRAPQLVGIMEGNGVGDHVVATDGRTPDELAGAILDLVGW